ncbi:uncharacterized protein LOC125312848 [Rhodamnia argentea]|uniref:Uncharacterized protein LOC125312848 n=1 Tax=Rhodamnia argentea TaxID=178133 RepID=A0ABM3GVQ2_9MYRT|nr:uncharacterized protein LOC125312848 [Rhodamnia argentea]
MERAVRIIRRSIHCFLKNIDSFNTPILILLPYSASLLLSRSLFPATKTTSLSLPQSLFRAISSFALALTFLAMAKSLVIQALTDRRDPSFPSSLSLYKRLVKLQFLHTSLALAADAIASVPHGFFSRSQGTLLALTSRTVSCAIAANLSAVCHVALAIAGIENCSAPEAIRRACSQRCREPAALLIALPHYLCFAAVEALCRFRYQSVMEDRSAKRPYLAMASEGVVIAWMYSAVVVLDTIACGLYVKSCESNSRTDEGANRGHSIPNVNDDDRCRHAKTADMA